jgi:hypothetical protein
MARERKGAGFFHAETTHEKIHKRGVLFEKNYNTIWRRGYNYKIVEMQNNYFHRKQD